MPATNKPKSIIRIRFYHPYDLDLIALALAPNFSITNAAKEALKYYAQHKKYTIEIPELPNYCEKEYVRTYAFYLYPEKKEEAAAIDLLNQIPEGKRNSFIKSIDRKSVV